MRRIWRRFCSQPPIRFRPRSWRSFSGSPGVSSFIFSLSSSGFSASRKRGGRRIDRAAPRPGGGPRRGRLDPACGAHAQGLRGPARLRHARHERRPGGGARPVQAPAPVNGALGRACPLCGQRRRLDSAAAPSGPSARERSSRLSG